LYEKIIHLKLYDRNPIRKEIVDRFEVRDFIKNRCNECSLVDILWHGEKFDIKTWKSLPKHFVIKANHGSAMTMIIDKSKHHFEEINKIVTKWKKINYEKTNKEWIYENLKKYLIIEEKLTFEKNIPPDFKFYCINGKVELIQVHVGRFGDHIKIFYDRDFNHVDAPLLYKAGYKVKKPKTFGLAVKIAERLSEEIDFIRVDLYLFDDKVYFGEMTCFPGAGYDKTIPLELDYELGSKLVVKIIN
jgi:hypothetical protein